MSIDVEKAMREIEGLANPSKKGRDKNSGEKEKSGSLLGGIFRKALFILFLAIVPFAVLLRGSSYAYKELAWGSWASLGLGFLVCLLVVTLYLVVLGKIVGIRKSMFKFSMTAGGAIVGVFILYSLLFVSAGNLKNDRLKSTYTDLHPLLRTSVSTMVLFDKSSVITDIGRTASDYDKMGLPRLENSLHFEQKDGFVHAIDFRTNGRGAIRNKLVQWYFKLCGFRTLRHVGTADHLHISLPLNK